MRASSARTSPAEHGHRHAPRRDLVPLLANIALSVLDEHFARTWQAVSGTDYQRVRRCRAGLANCRLVRYADDFVVMVAGTEAHARAQRETVTAVLAPMGLRLSEAEDEDLPH